MLGKTCVDGLALAFAGMTRLRGLGMKPPIKRFADLKAPPPPGTFAPPTPKVARRKPGKVLTAAEKAAFLASRPDLIPKD